MFKSGVSWIHLFNLLHTEGSELNLEQKTPLPPLGTVGHAGENITVSDTTAPA